MVTDTQPWWSGPRTARSPASVLVMSAPSSFMLWSRTQRGPRSLISSQKSNNCEMGGRRSPAGGRFLNNRLKESNISTSVKVIAVAQNATAGVFPFLGDGARAVGQCVVVVVGG